MHPGQSTPSQTFASSAKSWPTKTPPAQTSYTKTNESQYSWIGSQERPCTHFAFQSGTSETSTTSKKTTLSCSSIWRLCRAKFFLSKVLRRITSGLASMHRLSTLCFICICMLLDCRLKTPLRLERNWGGVSLKLRRLSLKSIRNENDFRCFTFLS